MRTPSLDRRHAALLTGVVGGCAVASLLVAAVGGTAVAQRSNVRAQAVFEATHLPPLLRLPGERVQLSYDVHCAHEGVEDPESGCKVTGTLFLRNGPRDRYRPYALEPTSVDGVRRLTAAVPTGDLGARGFEYYGEIEATGTTGHIAVPAGGADAPHRSLVLASPIEVNLGVHAFGSVAPGSRVASAPWGDGPASVGLESGRNLPAIGASAFDVDADGAVSLLDEAHRRVLRWHSSLAGPTRVPLSIDGRMADMSLEADGSFYVLESVASPGHTPLVRHFDPTGHELDAVETAERSPSQVRIGPDGPVVLQHPSHEWMAVSKRGAPVGPSEQRRNGRVGRPLRSGSEVVVLRRQQDVLVAIVSSRGVERSWRVTSDSPLAEVQLAEPIGQRFVLVVRVYSNLASEFVVLVLDRRGVERTFSTPTDEWAEATPLGRFRMAGDRLYRLGSDAQGAFITSYDLVGS
jgi:hypothetical protein